MEEFAVFSTLYIMYTYIFIYIYIYSYIYIYISYIYISYIYIYAYVPTTRFHFAGIASTAWPGPQGTRARACAPRVDFVLVALVRRAPVRVWGSPTQKKPNRGRLKWGLPILIPCKSQQVYMFFSFSGGGGRPVPHF